MSGRSILGNIKTDTRIYRIFPQNRFFELFEEKKNALSRPEKWKDPFENVFLKSKVRLPNGEVGLFNFHDDVYGQCWTLERSSDAMWRIYSADQDAVRVRTTVGRLIDSLRAAQYNMVDASCFIGRVRYQKVSQLKDFGKNMFVWHRGSEAIAQSLLVKRKAYRHENEVRLIYIALEQTRETDCIYKYDIDPLAVFDQAMVDGRVPKARFVALKEEIANRTGLAKKRIHRSVLYDPPNSFVVHGR